MLPWLETYNLGKDRSTQAPALLREFLTKHKIVRAYRLGALTEDVKVEQFYGVICVRPALGTLTHDNVPALIVIAKEIEERSKLGERVMVLDVPESVAKALATASGLEFKPVRLIGDRLEIQGIET